MSEATVVCELAESIVLEIFTNLGFIVAVERSNYFWSWKVGRHRIVQISLLSMAVGKWAHLAKGTRAGLLEMSAQRSFVLLPNRLVLFVLAVIFLSASLFLLCVLRRLILFLFTSLRLLSLLSGLLSGNRINEVSWRLILLEKLGSSLESRW